MPRVLIYFWSTYSFFPATQRVVISHNWAQPCFCVLNPVILIFSATFDYWLSLNCVLETQLCFCYPFYGDESQIFTTSQDLFLNSRSYTMPPLSSGFQPLTLCHRIIALAVSPPGKLFFPQQLVLILQLTAPALLLQGGQIIWLMCNCHAKLNVPQGLLPSLAYLPLYLQDLVQYLAKDE